LGNPWHLIAGAVKIRQISIGQIEVLPKIWSCRSIAFLKGKAYLLGTAPDLEGRPRWQPPHGQTWMISPAGLG